MNWWKRFKIGNQLSDEDKNAFLSYLRLDQALPVEVHSKNAAEFPIIQFDYKQSLANTYMPSDQWIQWAGFYLIQTSNRFGVPSNQHHLLDEELRNAGITFANELLQFSHQPLVCIADLPTLQLLSFAIGAKDVCEPIVSFDNIPHTLGITSSTIALEILNQWKNSFSSQHQRKVPLLLLDSNRLVNYTDNPTLFDNRSTAKLPTIESLKQRNIQTIIYATNSEIDLDDVHEDFCYYVNSGISIHWFNTQSVHRIEQKEFVKRSTMFSKRTSFINKV